MEVVLYGDKNGTHYYDVLDDGRFVRRFAPGELTAQMLYDVREAHGDIDGNDLHWLFEQLTGDPSPSGRTPIDPVALGWIGEENAEIDIGAFVRRVFQDAAR